MKFSLTVAAAALAASVAAPAFAADSTQFAIQHFNQSADTSSDRISVGPNGPALGTTVASMGDDGHRRPLSATSTPRSTVQPIA